MGRVPRILIVEDEVGLTRFLEKGLRASGFETTAVAEGAAARRLARDEDFDLMLLDLGLPDVDGQDVLRELRLRGVRMPVVVLTARDDLGDKVTSLDQGADDYVTKPFRFEELLARVNARLRALADDLTVLEAGGLRLNLRTRKATGPKGAATLSAREFTMLETLMRHPGQVLSREQLLSDVWGYDYDPGSNVVDVYVGYLRRKLGEEAIRTVRGMGYVVG
jgi:DNA-binding response OmpR family regulator